jgi:hypothetical protein
MLRALQAETAEYRAESPRHKTWMILSAGLSLALILAVFVNFLQWLLSPQGPERVKEQMLAECRGLVQAMQEIQPAYKDPENLVLSCLLNKFRHGSLN